MLMMALLLFSYVRPLTSRTVTAFRAVRISQPVQTLSSYVSLKSVATSRLWLRSCGTLFCHEPEICVTQSYRCLSSQCKVNSVTSFSTISKSGLEKTSGRQMCSKDTHSEKGRVEVLSASGEESHSPYGFSSNLLLSQSAQSSGSAAESGLHCSSNEHTVQSTATINDCSGVLGDSTPLHTNNTAAHTLSTPAYSDNTHSHTDNTLAYTGKTPEHTVNTPAHTDNTPVQADVDWEALQDLPPARPMKPSFNLAPYLPQSQVLQGLVALGVDLSAVEKVKGAADHLVQADWTGDIQPRLLFLRDLGLLDSQLGPVLTKNPLILQEDIEQMQERVSYLESKRFSQEQIIRIVTSAPLTLLLPVHYVDKKLGFLQTTFHLTGDEVRLVAAKLPKIIPWKLQKLKDVRFYMKEMLGFSDRELKSILLASPKVYLSDRHQLGKRFDLLHNVMGLSHHHLAAWPSVFRTRLHIIEQRHRFLVLRGRAQYDPTKENYVSLCALVSGSDQEFCEQVAKASPAQLYSFLRSI